MIQKLRAVFRNGAFILHDHCDLSENTEVRLSIEPPKSLAPRISDPAERREILKRVVARMQGNPVPHSAPTYSRDELHDRR